MFSEFCKPSPIKVLVGLVLFAWEYYFEEKSEIVVAPLVSMGGLLNLSVVCAICF